MSGVDKGNEKILHRAALVHFTQTASPSGRMQYHIEDSTANPPRPPSKNESFSSTGTCRHLSPTTGPLPTVHCWQSTMHCPDSANGEKDGPQLMKGRRFKVIVVLLNMTSFLVSVSPNFYFKKIKRKHNNSKSKQKSYKARSMAQSCSRTINYVFNLYYFWGQKFFPQRPKMRY